MPRSSNDDSAPSSPPDEGPVDLEGLPGAELIRTGLRDLAAGRRTVGSILVCIARPRFEELGFELGGCRGEDLELELYRMLGERGEADPYARYNALLAELSSFTEAASSRQRRSRTAR